MAKVTDEDKAKMRSLAASLREAEEHDHGTPEQRRDWLALANALRADIGAAPLSDEEDPPELEFFRRAWALGMARTSR